jgi:hypothetical protein
MLAFIEEDHDGGRRWIDIDSPAEAYLILTHWEGDPEAGVWVHRWYTRIVPIGIDMYPRFRYLTTRRDDVSPTLEQGGANGRWRL